MAETQSDDDEVDDDDDDETLRLRNALAASGSCSNHGCDAVLFRFGGAARRGEENKTPTDL